MDWHNFRNALQIYEDTLKEKTSIARGLGYHETLHIQNLAEDMAKKAVREKIGTARVQNYGLDLTAKLTDSMLIQIDMEGRTQLDALKEYMPHVKARDGITTSIHGYKSTFACNTLYGLDIEALKKPALEKFKNNAVLMMIQAGAIINDCQPEYLELVGKSEAMLDIMLESKSHPDFELEYFGEFTDGSLLNDGYDGLISIHGKGNDVTVTGQYQAKPNKFESIDWLVKND